MLGVEQAGIAETVDYALTKFSADEQRRLCQVHILTKLLSGHNRGLEEWGRTHQILKSVWDGCVILYPTFLV